MTEPTIEDLLDSGRAARRDKRTEDALRDYGAAVRLVALGLLTLLVASPAVAEPSPDAGERITIESGGARLQAVFFRPPGKGPFPAILFLHGSGEGFAPERYRIADVFTRRGYAFLILCRRGAGLSKDAGEETAALMQRERTEHGLDARNALQIRLLEGRELEDTLAALAVLRSRADVDRSRIALLGHSFGGCLALLVASRDHDIRAVVDFGGGARSWPESPILRDRLRTAVYSIHCPVLFVQAENDYSVEPSKVLAAEMERGGGKSRARVYPALGSNAAAGHDLLFRGVSLWEREVLGFLGEVAGGVSPESPSPAAAY